MRRMTLATALFLTVVWHGSAVGAAPVKLVFHNEAQSVSTRFDVPHTLKPVTPPPPRPRGCTAPGNDDCANATPILSVPFTDTVDTACATDEAGEPPSACTFAANSIWYTYVNTALNPTMVTIDTFLSDFDTTLQVLTGPCGGQTPIACDDDAGGLSGLQSLITFMADPGVIYFIQAAGFGGATGNMVLNVTATENCPLSTLNGTLGSAASTGLQTGRLFRDGIPSTCATPKACDILKPDGTRPFDSYSIPNLAGTDQCLRVHLEVPDNQGTGTCDLQSNAYLNTYDSANICTNYLADPGASTGGDPHAPTDFSFVLPADDTAVIVVHSIDPDSNIGCNYTVTTFTDVCGGAPVDADVSLAKTLTTAGAIFVGDNVSFALAVSNNGPGSATAVTVTDTLPAGLTYVSNDCGAVFASPTLTWTVGALAANGSATCHLTATVNQPGTITNAATATANESDPVSANNSSTSAATVQQRVVEVPALGPGGLLALLALLGGVGLAMVRRRVPKT